MADRCTIPRRWADAEIVYLDHGVCDVHWNRLNADDAPPEALRMALGIKADAPAAMEVEMQETTTTAAESAAQEETMAAKKTTATKAARASRKATTTKAAVATKKTKTPRGPKPKKERVPKEDAPKRVFAIRVTDEELAEIHKASGPRNATRFIRAVAAAFTAEDEAAFKAVLKEAREARV